MKTMMPLCLAAWIAFCSGCIGPASSNRLAGPAIGQADMLTDKTFVSEVLRYVYRWHFDQSYVLETGNLAYLEVWTRPLHPTMDADDRSEFGELWMPAIKTVVELKRARYSVPELKLEINDPTFKVKRVTRQLRAPAPKRAYQISRYSVQELRDFLFATRTNQVPISDALRRQARSLAAAYLAKEHPEPFTQPQTFYVSPLSGVCNEIWLFWESGRKLMLFSADVDLASAAFAQLSQLRIEVIDLDKNVVASPREVPGSNAFVTKDWVGRMLYNCILFGEKIVRTPDELRLLREAPSS